MLDRLLLEFESPLQDLAAYTDQLTHSIGRVNSDRELTTFLEEIQIGSQRVAHLAEDYIFMTELRTGEAKENFRLMSEFLTPVQLCDQIRYFVETSGFQFNSDSNWKSEGEIGRICAYPARLALGLQRLAKTLDNFGADVTSPAQISAWYEPADLYVQVASNGVNLKAEEMARISRLLEATEAVVAELSEFDPALPVAKGVAYLHNGVLSLKQLEGRGLGFLLRLPIIESQQHDNSST